MITNDQDPNRLCSCQPGPKLIAHWISLVLLVSLLLPATLAQAEDVELSVEASRAAFNQYRSELKRLSHQISSIQAEASYSETLELGFDADPPEQVNWNHSELKCITSLDKFRYEENKTLHKEKGLVKKRKIDLGKVYLSPATEPEFEQAIQTADHVLEKKLDTLTVFISNGNVANVARGKSGAAQLRLVSHGSPTKKNTYLASINKYFRPQVTCCDYYLPAMVDSSNIDLMKAVKTDSGRIRFSFRGNGLEKKELAGSWTVNPDRHWRLEEFAFNEEYRSLQSDNRTGPAEFDIDNKIRGVVKYHESAAKAVLPKSVEYYNDYKMFYGKNISYRKQLSRVEFKDYRIEASPASVFSMAGFGLAEADRPPTDPMNGLRMSLFGIAVATLLAGLALKYWKHRLVRRFALND